MSWQVTNIDGTQQAKRRQSVSPETGPATHLCSTYCWCGTVSSTCLKTVTKRKTVFRNFANGKKKHKQAMPRHCEEVYENYTAHEEAAKDSSALTWMYGRNDQMIFGMCERRTHQYTMSKLQQEEAECTTCEVPSDWSCRRAQAFVMDSDCAAKL
ncbi:hypothetical protein EK904_006442 [Melospiza melodia maxima]|nr:hypothetical protein EK904_006442 [Melospiza melodia maxima]